MDTRQLNEKTKKAGIEFPTILPLFRNPPDRKAVQEWVDKHDTTEINKHFPELKPLAEKIAKHINYIPYETFLEKLKITINDFHKKTKEDPYVLWIAQDAMHLKAGASDAWVAGLAFEHCGLRTPAAIFTTNRFVDFLKSNYVYKHHFGKENYIKHILLLDDASYSANHILDEINHIHTDSLIETEDKRIITILENYYQFYIGIPFMTSIAEQKISDNIRINASLLAHTKLPMLKELLDEKEIKLLESVGTTVRSKTLSYFDHRFPDVWSTLSQIEDGYNLLCLGKMDAMEKMGYTPETMAIDEWNKLVPKMIPDSLPLIPTVIPPYRLHDERGQESLKRALEKRTLGLRTQYPVPERYKAVIDMLQLAEAKTESNSKALRLVSANSQTFFKPALGIVAGASCISLFIKLTDFRSDHLVALVLTCFLFLYCKSKSLAQDSIGNSIMFNK